MITVKQNKLWILGLIFVVALAVRFFYFRETIYFGFDEARDALVSENIYLKGDIRLIGPPATGDTGLFHGPAYWYMVGPLYILFGGNLYLMAALFKLINAVGVFVVYGIGKKLFSEKIGLVAAFLFAISFEQSQYATYVGKESIALILWLLTVYSVVSILKTDLFGKNFSLPVIAFSFGLMLQFNIIYAGFGIGLLGFAIVIFNKLKHISKKSWLWSAVLFGLMMSSYLLAELKYDFREIKSAINLVTNGFGIMSPGESKYTLYWNKYLIMFRDNIIGLSINVDWQKLSIIIVTITFTVWLLARALKEKSYAILLIWLWTWMGIMLAGGHMAYYTNVATSVSILVGVALILDRYVKNKYLFWIVLVLVTTGNLSLINSRRISGLIPAIKPQPYMNLIDERKIVDQMYTAAGGRGFTLRLTGIPYKIQTVWYYLLREYGYKKYGYFPYWEHGNVAGYPGELPTPKNGTTCLRFLVREPMTGLPISLVELDEEEENYFSKLVTRSEIGLFTIEERLALGNDCHNDKP